jgi:nucleoid-associated protein YgaU
MTRETKIGLLVGLAFIIVIGILLSDHLTSSTEPPAAVLTNVGNNVRQGVTAPGTPVHSPVTPPTNPQPQAQVPIRQELTNRPAPTPVVEVGGPLNPTRSPAAVDSPVVTIEAPPVATEPLTPRPSPQEPAALNPEPAPGLVLTQSELAEVSRAVGEELVPVDRSGRPIQSTTPAPPRASSETIRHVIEPGDSVSRLAARYLGANTRANREAIIRLNPSLQKDPNTLILGQVCLIPAPGTVRASNAADNPPAVSGPMTPVLPATPGASGTQEYWYTVREGDSLWRIASEQLGKGGSAVAAIKELNKDVLKGSDVVHPGMKLRLPGRPVTVVRGN